MPESAWDRARRLLAVRLDAMGDVVMTTPALRALKESRPDRHLTLLTSPAGAGVATLMPTVDDVIVYDAPWSKSSLPHSMVLPDAAMLTRLREGHYDGAVIFTVHQQNPLPAALMCYLAEIPLRLAHCHENPYQLLTDWVLDPEPATLVRHEVRRQLDLVATIGCRPGDVRLSLEVPPLAHQRIIRLLDAVGLDRTRTWAVIHPGALVHMRHYPPEAFALVARRLVADHGWQVLFTGDVTEAGLVAGIQAYMQAPSLSLTGRLPLAEQVGLLALAPLLIADDGGTVQIAAAVGTPVVDLYAPTNSHHTPWAVPNRVLTYEDACSACYDEHCTEPHHHCLHQITPEELVAAALGLMAETSTLPPGSGLP